MSKLSLKQREDKRIWRRWKGEVAGHTKENLTEVEMKDGDEKTKTLEGTKTRRDWKSVEMEECIWKR